MSRYHRRSFSFEAPIETVEAALPSLVEVKCWFNPADAVGGSGVDAAERTTVPEGKALDIQLKPDGSHFVTADVISAVDVAVEGEACSVRIRGARIVLSKTCKDLKQVIWLVGAASEHFETIASAMFELPVSVVLDALFIDGAEVSKIIAPRPPLELRISRHGSADDGCRRVGEAVSSAHRCASVFHALSYYRRGLLVDGFPLANAAGFAEVILNLSKAVEVMFPKNWSLRMLGPSLGLSQAEIEFLCALRTTLRDTGDVAHAAMGSLDKGNRDCLEEFKKNAMRLLSRTLKNARRFRISCG